MLIGLACLLGAIILLSAGYLIRDSIVLKRENVTLWSLLDARQRVAQTDKLVDENGRLKAELRKVGGQERSRVQSGGE